MVLQIKGSHLNQWLVIKNIILKSSVNHREKSRFLAESCRII